MKKIIKITLTLLLISVLIMSIYFMWDNKIFDTSNNVDNETIELSSGNLFASFVNGKEIDEKLSFGNKTEVKFSLTNNEKKQVLFSIVLDNYDNIDDSFSYSVFYSTNDEEYEKIIDNELLIGETLVNGLKIDPNETISFKIQFRSIKETNENKLFGTLMIVDPFSKKDIFKDEITLVHKSVLNRVSSLNGISIPGNYILEINNKLKGYVIIDASDIIDIKYIYTLYNDNYIVKNYKYGNSITIDEYDSSTLSFNTICSNYSKNSCSSFSELKPNKTNPIDEFSNKIEKVISKAKEEGSKLEQGVYVFDLTEDLKFTDIAGYILFDNIKNELFLYLKNDLYMITGYNYSKLGNFKKAIRAFNENSFNLSGESKYKVCSFSGYQECLDIKKY